MPDGPSVFSCSPADPIGSSHPQPHADFNTKDSSGEGPCFIYLAQHLDATAPSLPPPLEDTAAQDFPRGRSQVNWSDTKLQDLLSFLPWSHLRRTPPGLERPDRFRSWIDGGLLHVRPSPAEELCIHSDGSFVPGSSVAGWGLVFSKRPAGASGHDGMFIGCAWGSYASVAPFFGQMQHMLDAHLMEVTGLMWAAIAVLQLRYFGRVAFESDCQSALLSAKGMGKTRQHPLCRAMAALHMCVRISMADAPAYLYVPGHCGTSRNELADALAHFGSHHPDSEGPFRIQLPLWFQDDHDGFAWAPHAFLCREHPQCMPGFVGGSLHWEARVPDFQKDPLFSLQPFLPAEVLQSQPARMHTDTLLFRVASFNTLSLLEPDGASRGACRQGLYGEAGRTALLAQCLSAKGIHIAGIQEARTPQGQVIGNGFLRLCSGPDPAGNLGNEIWVSLTAPFGTALSPATLMQRPDAVVLHTEPSLLIVRLRSAFLHVIVASMHAPHRAHSMEHRTQWWHHATRVCVGIDRGDEWVLALDGNIRVGSHVSESIGGWHADQEDAAAEAAHHLFMRLRVFLPATFQECMYGEGGTLFQKRNGKLDRSDFVALPLAWADTCPSAWIDSEIHVGHKGLDHLASVTEIQLRCNVRRTRKAARPRIDAASLRDEANHGRICQIIADAPRCPWDMNVHEHVASLVGYLQSSLADAFPAPRLRQRPSFLSSSSLELHRALAATRAKLKRRCEALRLSRMACAFDAWRSNKVEDTFSNAFQGSWLADLHCHIAIDVYRVQSYSTVLKKSSRQDKAAHISQLAVHLCQAAPNEVHAAFKALVRPARKTRGGSAPLPCLRKLDGSLCQDFHEVQQRWREHFSMLEAGAEVSPKSLLEGCFHGQTARDLLLDVPGKELPTITALSDAMRATACRKAPGPDDVPPELCRFFGNEMAVLWFPVLLKTLLLSSEAIGLKGTVLHRIPKPSGARNECLSHRAVVVQSCFAKAIQRSIRHLLSAKLEDSAHSLVFGGRSGQSALFGSFLSRAFVRVTKSRHVSASVVFCDLASAYYRVIRELLVGHDAQQVSLRDICAGLSLAESDLQFIANTIATDPVLASDSAFLRRTIQEVGHFSWFLMFKDNQVVHTRRGTRPGGPIADLLFSVLFIRTLETRRLEHGSGNVPLFRWDGVRALQPAPHPRSPGPSLVVRDIVYADDLSILNVSDSARSIGVVTSHSAGRVMDAFAESGFVANLGASKTAALVMPRGPGARAARSDLFGSKKGMLPTLRENQGGVQLPLIHQYSHLGGLLTHTGGLQGEIRKRLNLARAVFKEAKRAVFGRRAVPLCRRVSLFQSRVLSVLFYASGGWPTLQVGEAKEFFGGFLSLCRQLLAIPAMEDQRWSEPQILAGVGLPSAQVCLHIERLRFMLLITRNGPDELWAVARADAGFLASQSAAFEWLYSRVGNCLDLPSPAVEWEPWVSLMHTSPGRFKGIIRRAAKAEVIQQGIHAMFDTTTRGIWEKGESMGANPGESSGHGCLKCRTSFPSRQAWGAHASRKHGYRSLGHQLTRGTQCQACRRTFQKAQKLTLHLKASPKCLWFIDGLNRDGRLEVVCNAESHVLAPPLGPDEPVHLPEVPSPICHELLDSLLTGSFCSDEEVLDCVSDCIQPLPLLLDTIKQAILFTSDPVLGEFLANVVLCVEDGCVFEHHQGDAAHRKARSFQPLLKPFPSSVCHDVVTVTCNTLPDANWLNALGLSTLPLRWFNLRTATRDELLEARALYVLVDEPPLRADLLWQPPAAAIGPLNQHRQWCFRTLQLLECATKLAYLGRAVFIRWTEVFPEELGSLTPWLAECGATAGTWEPASSLLFHHEFVCKRRIRLGSKPA